MTWFVNVRLQVKMPICASKLQGDVCWKPCEGGAKKPDFRPQEIERGKREWVNRLLKQPSAKPCVRISCVDAALSGNCLCSQLCKPGDFHECCVYNYSPIFRFDPLDISYVVATMNEQRRVMVLSPHSKGRNLHTWPNQNLSINAAFVSFTLFCVKTLFPLLRLLTLWIKSTFWSSMFSSTQARLLTSIYVWLQKEREEEKTCVTRHIFFVIAERDIK